MSFFSPGLDDVGSHVSSASSTEWSNCTVTTGLGTTALAGKLLGLIFLGDFFKIGVFFKGDLDCKSKTIIIPKSCLPQNIYTSTIGLFREGEWEGDQSSLAFEEK